MVYTTGSFKQSKAQLLCEDLRGISYSRRGERFWFPRGGRGSVAHGSVGGFPWVMLVSMGFLRVFFLWVYHSLRYGFARERGEPFSQMDCHGP